MSDSRKIRNSAKALIIRDGRMAAVKIRDGSDEWYIMPGGGQMAGETLHDAVKREVAEELGIDVDVGELLFVVEGTHGENFHRVDVVFDCAYVGEVDMPEIHCDTNQVGIEWLDVATLNHAPLYPSKLRRQIMNIFEGKPHAVYLGSESVGDAEITE